MLTIQFKYLSIQPGSRILDMGCGSGRHTAALYEQSASHVVGADLQLGTLIEARRRMRFHEQVYPDRNGRWSLTANDITCLPFKEGSFDMVLCSEVLEHIPDHRQAIRELLRVLKPNGPLVVSVPRRWPEALCWALSGQYRRSAGGHIRIYARETLIELIRRLGADHWLTHYAHSLHTPFWWLKCLLGIERDHLWPVKRYHQFLTWDMMAKPRLTQLLDRWLNPIMGKSVVLYFSKQP